MDLGGAEREGIVHKDTGDLVEMFCPESNGHVQLTLFIFLFCFFLCCGTVLIADACFF